MASPTLISSLKGAALEWLMGILLETCGFHRVNPDGLYVYKDRTTGLLMVHGLGQPHNIDVLMSPPFQMPFYFPSRIAVECKCYQRAVGLDTLRSVLGLRTDLNCFEIVDSAVLKSRANPRTATLSQVAERYNYQVVVASTSGFTATAQSFALTHRIPLISFERAEFWLPLRQWLKLVGDQAEQLDENEVTDLIHWLKCCERRELHPRSSLGGELLTEVLGLLSHITVGVLDNGQIIFAYSDTDVLPQGGHYQSSLHWSRQRSAWEIRLHRQNTTDSLYFELPATIYNQWAASEFSKEAARRLKRQYMKRIVLFRKSDGRLKVVLLDATGYLEQPGWEPDQQTTLFTEDSGGQST